MTEICKKCSQEKEMYYGLWCPRCDVPEIVVTKELNFIQALEHLEAIGHKGIKGRLWEYATQFYSFSNDSLFWMHLEKVEFEQINKDLELIKKTWDIKEDGINMNVSW